MVRLGEVLPKWALAAAGLADLAAGEPASGGVITGMVREVYYSDG
jgi:hypothetical protein